MAASKQTNYRLDKWLWAARFFKTRSIAADAVSSGKVRVDGHRAKSAKEVKVGMFIVIKNKGFEIEVEVIALSNIRRGAPEAALLYQETAQSKQKKEQLEMARKAESGIRDKGMGRPTKRQQRDIKRFTGLDY